MTTYLTYRNSTGPIEARIQSAVKAFYVKRQQLPAAIVVNPNEIDAALAAAGALAGVCVARCGWQWPREVITDERFCVSLIGSRVLSGLVEQSLYNWLPKEHLP